MGASVSSLLKGGQREHVNCTLKQTAVVFASPSSGSRTNAPRKYEVFVSFRGDTRNNFTSHLHAALKDAGVESFRDDKQLERGDEIAPSLIQAIKDSSVSIVVFSKGYAYSRWCLDELVQIMQCRRNEGQFVIPIFYKVDPSHVRKQIGAYEKAFEQHEKDFMHDPERVNRWKAALSEAGYLSGRHCQDSTDESNFIQEIVADVSIKLEQMHNNCRQTLKDVIGMDEMIKPIEELLGKFHRVGIWGMGGVGKTTMANVVFAKLSAQYDSCCFLENIREKIEKNGLESVRTSLVSELLRQDIPINRSNVLRNSFVARRLCSKKALVVLDDVDDSDQLEDLQEKICDLLGEGSKVVVTTRNKKLLRQKGYEIYEAKGLSYHNSRQLFICKAFGSDQPEDGYERLIEGFVDYSQHNPLALKVLGSYVYTEDKSLWDGLLTKLREGSPHNKIQKVLRLSYDGLAYHEKQTFLDIACFFKGKLRRYVEVILENFGFHPSIGLTTLMDKALISVSCDVVWMHDLVQSMAFGIIHEECITNPGGRSRLWKPNEIYDALKNDRGTDAIQAISLDLSQIKDLQLSTDVFRKMPYLRFLEFHYSRGHERSCTVNLSSGLESLPNSLRHLQWDNFPSKCLPSSFSAEKLFVLRMKGSHLEKLGDGMQNFVNLREIDLAGSKQLIELPDLSTAQKLEQVDLTDCESLRHLHPLILSLPRLTDLKLRRCRNLKSLKCESQSKSLLHLDVYDCSSLKEFSFSSDKMKYLSLEGTCVEILDFSSGRMEKLKRLCLNGSTLKNLPINDICYMRSLEELHLYDYGGTIDKSKLHGLFDASLSLQTIDLSGTCKLTELPNNIKHLSRLQHLNVSGCKDLQSFPELPPSIEVLDAGKCTSLKTLRFTSHIESSLSIDEITSGSTFCSSVSCLKNLRQLILNDCEQLYEIPAGIKHLSNLKEIELRNCRRLRSLPELPPFFYKIDAGGCISLETHVMESAYSSLRRLVCTRKRGRICYCGRKAPEWFTFNQVKRASREITVELPFSTSDVIGFISCTVLSVHGPTEFLCDYANGLSRISTRLGKMKNSDSRHVFLWCDDCSFEGFNNEKGDQNTNYRPKAPFKFSLHAESGVADGVIEECGVWPIFVSEYSYFIQQMELQSNLDAQKETRHGADENSFHGIREYASFSLNQGKCGNFEGSIIPEWFTYKGSTIWYQSSGAWIRVRFALDIDNLMGFIFCFVIPQFSSKKRDEFHSRCNFYLDDVSPSLGGFNVDNYLTGPIGWHYSMEKLNSDNVFRWYDPHYSELIVQKLRKKGKGHDEELEFKFLLGDSYNCNFEECNCWIKECGVRPIYFSEFSEYKNFLLQPKKKNERGMKKKRPQNIDDDQYQLPSTKKLKESSIIQSIPQNPESKTSHDVDKVLLLLSQLNLESTKDHNRRKK